MIRAAPSPRTPRSHRSHPPPMARQWVPRLRPARPSGCAPRVPRRVRPRDRHGRGPAPRRPLPRPPPPVPAPRSRPGRGWRWGRFRRSPGWRCRRIRHRRGPAATRRGWPAHGAGGSCRRSATSRRAGRRSGRASPGRADSPAPPAGRTVRKECEAMRQRLVEVARGVQHVGRDHQVVAVADRNPARSGLSRYRARDSRSRSRHRRSAPPPPRRSLRRCPCRRSHSPRREAPAGPRPSPTRCRPRPRSL